LPIAIPPARTAHRRTRLTTALLVVTVACGLTTLGPVVPARAQTATIKIASKNFPGAQVLSQAYGQALAARGANVTFADDVGATEVVFPALLAGTYDAYADYQGTLLTFLGGKPSSDAGATHAALVKKLAGTGITVSEPAPAVDVNGFYVTRKTANRLDLRTVSDLRSVAPKLTIGGPPECTSRPLCLGDASARAYGLRFAKVVSFDPNTSQTRRALRRGDIDVAILFTGSSIIPADAVLLRDDRALQPADNPVLLMRDGIATPATVAAVDAVSAKITTSTYNSMSIAVSRDQQDPTEVAARFLADAHLP
jgi:osmoprotectant transport system substrate-binding protein